MTCGFPGDAFFYNRSIRKDLDLIRMELGVCPQHDVLWGDLTAVEHMQLFGSLKGLTPGDMQHEMDTLLRHVQLDKVKGLRHSSTGKVVIEIFKKANKNTWNSKSNTVLEFHKKFLGMHRNFLKFLK